MKAAIILFVFGVTLSAGAVESKDPELLLLCADLKKAMTQTDMNIASGRIAEYWDRRLQAVEKRIEAELGDKEREEFAKSKARWSKYRSEEVSYRASFFKGGSIQPLIASSHYAGITEHRVDELEAFFTDVLDN